MNLNQFTQKSVEAIQAAQQLAGERFDPDAPSMLDRWNGVK